MSQIKKLSAPNFLKIPWKFMSCLVCKAIFVFAVACKTLIFSHHPPGPNLFQNIRRIFISSGRRVQQRNITLNESRMCIFRMATAVIGRCVFGQLNKLQKCKTIAKVTNIQCRNISISQRLLGGRCHFICAVEIEQWTWRIIIHYNNSVNDLRFKYSNCEYMCWYLWPIYHIAEVDANFSRILIYLHNALIEIINETMTS